MINNTDTMTGSLIGIDYAHHEVHDGRHFVYSEYSEDLDTDATIEILITVPDSERWPHVLFSVDGQLKTKVELFETCTHTAGVVKAAYNNNRNSTNNLF